MEQIYISVIGNKKLIFLDEVQINYNSVQQNMLIICIQFHDNHHISGTFHCNVTKEI